jgi:hypothetical protein
MARRIPRKRRVPTHLRKIQYLARLGVLKLAAGSAMQIDMSHDDWCTHFDGKACNCNPVIRHRWTVPAGSQNCEEEPVMELWHSPAAIEAQFLMGHCVPAFHVGDDQQTIVDCSWDVDQVRQQLHVPADALWDERVLALEVEGLAHFSFYTTPVTYDEHGQAHEIPGWRDQPREHWGSLSVYAAGVLRLSVYYGRPYVRYHQAPDVLFDHWRLVQEEATARLHAPHDMARWQREFPEDYVVFQAQTRGLLPED